MELRKRFGRLVAAQRRRAGLTQQQLAVKADLSGDMIAQIERGVKAAGFPTIERLAAVLGVDPAEFFTTEVPKGALHRAKLTMLTAKLAGMDDDDLKWIEKLIDVALERRR